MKELASEEKLENWLLRQDAEVTITMPDGKSHTVTGEVWKVQHGDGGGVQIEVLAFIEDDDVPDLP